jgi:hypothetical protein
VPSSKQQATAASSKQQAAAAVPWDAISNGITISCVGQPQMKILIKKKNL